MSDRTKALILFAVITHAIAALGGYTLGRGVNFLELTGTRPAGAVEVADYEPPALQVSTQQLRDSMMRYATERACAPALLMRVSEDARPTGALAHPPEKWPR